MVDDKINESSSTSSFSCSSDQIYAITMTDQSVAENVGDTLKECTATPSRISSDPAIHVEASTNLSCSSSTTDKVKQTSMRPSHSDGNLMERFRRGNSLVANFASGVRKSFSLQKKGRKSSKKDMKKISKDVQTGEQMKSITSSNDQAIPAVQLTSFVPLSSSRPSSYSPNSPSTSTSDYVLNSSSISRQLSQSSSHRRPSPTANDNQPPVQYEPSSNCTYQNVPFISNSVPSTSSSSNGKSIASPSSSKQNDKSLGKSLSKTVLSPSSSEKRSWLHKPMTLMNCCITRTDSVPDVATVSTAESTTNSREVPSTTAPPLPCRQQNVMSNEFSHQPSLQDAQIVHVDELYNEDVASPTDGRRTSIREDLIAAFYQSIDAAGHSPADLPETVFGIPIRGGEMNEENFVALVENLFGHLIAPIALTVAEERQQRERDFYLQEAEDEADTLFYGQNGRRSAIGRNRDPAFPGDFQLSTSSFQRVSPPPVVDVEDEDIAELRQILSTTQSSMTTFSHPDPNQLFPSSNYPLQLGIGGGGSGSGPPAFPPDNLRDNISELIDIAPHLYHMFPPTSAAAFRQTVLAQQQHRALPYLPAPVSDTAANRAAAAAAYAASISPPVHTQIDYINCLVPDLKAISNCSFYWGKMDRYEAERLLEGKPEGTFLLRDSAQEDHLFSVSFRRFDRSLHARIEQWKHRFSFDSHDPGVYSSPTVTGLIEHYKDPSHCMFFEPMLTKPLHRAFVFSLQHLARATICDRISYQTINDLPLPIVLKSHLRQYHFSIKVRTKHFDEFTYYQ